MSAVHPLDPMNWPPCGAGQEEPMLFKLNLEHTKLDPVPFQDFAAGFFREAELGR